ncbi:MAG TPA: cytochrome c oxidase subunit 3 family protein [Anaerolineales bacterium]
MTDLPAKPAQASNPEVSSLEISSLGMWLFLATEVMFFGAVFTAYMIYRRAYPAAFAEASSHLNILLGSTNTAILLTSSLAMALAVHAAQLGKRKTLIFFLFATIVLGLIFLGVKGLEWYQEFQAHLYPGGIFEYPGNDPAKAKLFFSLYFTLTGLHAVHMIIGIFLLAVLTFFAWRGRFSIRYYTPVEIVGLFWHFIDIVWIFIFPLLYLIHRS